MHRAGRVDLGSAGKTKVDQPESPGISPLGEGVTEAQPGGGQVQSSAFKSRVLPDSELSSLGIVKGGDSRYYKA